MPERIVSLIEPAIRHGLRELQAGAPVQHVLREVAILGGLMGSGMPAGEALQYLERHEAELIGMFPGEARVEPGYHAGAGRPPGGTTPPQHVPTAPAPGTRPPQYPPYGPQYGQTMPPYGTMPPQYGTMPPGWGQPGMMPMGQPGMMPPGYYPMPPMRGL